MKAYPSIPHVSDFEIGKYCLMFEKLDGSNLRIEWSDKSGWYKFGTRKRLFDISDDEFGCAIPIFQKTFADKLDNIFRNNLKIKNAIVYCEFFGKYSFAGHHRKNDPKQLVLFDVNIHKKGFIEPQRFVDIFSPILPTANMLYAGVLTEELVSSVKSGDFPVNEGVICKGGAKTHEIWMCKIKTNKYLEDLKNRFKENWRMYE